jgi:hypothetical protein
MWPWIALGLLVVGAAFGMLLTDPHGSASPSVTVAPRVAVVREAQTLPIIGGVDGDASSFARAAGDLSGRVERASGGGLQLRYTSNDFEGKSHLELEIARAVLDGRIAMAMITASPLSNYDSQLEVFDLPFLFDSDADFDRALAGPARSDLLRGGFSIGSASRRCVHNLGTTLESRWAILMTGPGTKNSAKGRSFNDLFSSTHQWE